MQLTVLVDNNTLIDRYFLAEPGLSIFIETESKRILFDVGYSDAFIRNAGKMNINLLNIDYLAFSHGHFDHIGGLDSLLKLYAEALLEKIEHHKPTLIAHPLVFYSKIYEGFLEIGSNISEEKISRHFELRLTKEPFWLTEKLVFLGEIPRKNDFEGKAVSGKVRIPEIDKVDYLLDDTALAYKSPNGLVIITGCSHSGICNIVEYAKDVCNEHRVIDIIGGFHLQNPSQKQLQGTLEYMKGLKLDALHACHCTDLKSKTALSNVASQQEVGVGLKLEFE